jgi:hypothetical protein
MKKSLYDLFLISAGSAISLAMLIGAVKIGLLPDLTKPCTAPVEEAR